MSSDRQPVQEDPLPGPGDPWPPNGLEAVEVCPVCGAEQRSLLYRGLSDQVFQSAPGKWTLYRCSTCGSAYLDPRPTPETIHLAYQRYYTHEAPPHLPDANLGLPRRVLRRLANGYRNHHSGGELEPSWASGRWVLPLFPSKRRVMDRGLRYLPPVWEGARLLDVGSGNGAFLSIAQGLGWEAVGVDIDPRAVAMSRELGLDVRQGAIDALDPASESFDVITMSHIVEHVHDPRALLAAAFELLRPGGLLYLDTPNIDAPGHQRFGRSWRGLEPPRHLVLLSWEAVEQLLADAGFAPVTPRTTADNYARLATASRALADDRDPYVDRHQLLRDRVRQRWRTWRVRHEPRQGEFITLLAQRPAVL